MWKSFRTFSELCSGLLVRRKRKRWPALARAPLWPENGFHRGVNRIGILLNEYPEIRPFRDGEESETAPEVLGGLLAGGDEAFVMGRRSVFASVLSAVGHIIENLKSRKQA